MLRLITLIFVGVAYSRTERCCVPSQMQASLLIGEPYVPIKNKNRYVDIYYDYPNKRFRTVYDGGEMELLLYNECEKGPPRPWVGTTCIPENATASKPYNLGWKPNITPVDFYWQDNEEYVQMTLMNCTTPIEMVTWYGYPTDYEMTRTVFQDYIPTIMDKHAFDVPDICKKAQMIKDNKKVHLGYFGLGNGMLGKKFTGKT